MRLGYHTTMVVEQIVILTRLSEREAHTFEAVNKVKVIYSKHCSVCYSTHLCQLFSFTVCSLAI